MRSMLFIGDKLLWYLQIFNLSPCSGSVVSFFHSSVACGFGKVGLVLFHMLPL